MSADRPNFQTIAQRVREETTECYARKELGRSLDFSFRLQIEISDEVRNSIDRIPVDKNGTMIRATRYQDGTQISVRITSKNPQTGNSNEGEIFKIENDEAFNSAGEILKGDRLREAEAVAEVIRQHLLNEWRKKLISQGKKFPTDTSDHVLELMGQGNFPSLGD